MSFDQAAKILRDAYAAINEGQLLRRTHKLLRKRDIDPPMDVQYVAEPTVEPDPRGWAIRLNTDILVYEEFPEMEACLVAFEDALSELLVLRLEKVLKRVPR